MYELKVTSSFAAAHALRGYGDPCEDLHGHNYKVEVCISASALNAIGIAIDFKLVKKYLEDVLKEVDHKYLNDLDMFKEENPSAEIIACWIFRQLKPKIDDVQLRLKRITIYETENFSATYFED